MSEEPSPSFRQALRQVEFWLLLLATLLSTSIWAPNAMADDCAHTPGAAYSALRHGCINLYDDAVRLDDVRIGRAGPELSAYVVFVKENQPATAELYLPPAFTAIPLPVASGRDTEIWENASYKLSRWKHTYKLETFIGGDVLFMGEVSK